LVFFSGTYNIFIKQGAQDVKVGCCENKGSFGELALMYNMPRAATIQSAGDGMLWAMDRQTFRRIVLRNAFQKRKMYESLLEKVPLLSSLNPYERMNLADTLTSKIYKRGSIIIHQGDPADGMYFVETGEVSVTVVGNDGSERQVWYNKCSMQPYYLLVFPRIFRKPMFWHVLYRFLT